MEPRWKVFIFTFLSYALVHASRTSWSSLKYTLNSTPFSFSPVYLGTLDMMVLFALAVTLVLFGPKVVSRGPKEYLQRGMIAVAIVLVVLGILLVLNVTKRYLYLMIYPLVGVFSFVGWPACLYVNHP
jgi:sugar phosphate permease